VAALPPPGRVAFGLVAGKSLGADPRVDVDDLVALALALDVTPNQLLLPADTWSSSAVPLTTSVAMDASAAWRWAVTPAVAEEARPVLILTALDLEYDAVRQQLTGLQTYQHPAGTLFEIAGTSHAPGSIVIGVTGPGNSGAAVQAERAITAFQPQALLFAGIAGALSEDLAIGDVVVATRVYDYHGDQPQGDGFSARPHVWEAPHRLEQLARYVARAGAWRKPEANPPAVHFRPIATGAKVVSSRTPALAGLSDAAAIDMESAGVAQVGQLNQAPVLTIRGISDRADEKKHGTDAASNQAVAAAHAAWFSVSLASEIISTGQTEHRPATAPVTSAGLARTGTVRRRKDHVEGF
jgi:adenosylhomocysteine nucleosidase